MPAELTEAIRGVLRDYGRLAVDVNGLDERSDLYEAGLTSHASVNLMLALEEHFEVEFPERMLRRGAFREHRRDSVGPERAVGGRRMTRPAVADDLLETARRIGVDDRRTGCGCRRPRGTLSARSDRRPARGAPAWRARAARSSAVAARRSASSPRSRETLGRSCASTAMVYAMHQIEVACLVRHGLASPFIRASTSRSSPSRTVSSRRRRPSSASAAICDAACARSSATRAVFA